MSADSSRVRLTKRPGDAENPLYIWALVKVAVPAASQVPHPLVSQVSGLSVALLLNIQTGFDFLMLWFSVCCRCGQGRAGSGGQATCGGGGCCGVGHPGRFTGSAGGHTSASTTRHGTDRRERHRFEAVKPISTPDPGFSNPEASFLWLGAWCCRTSSSTSRAALAVPCPDWPPTASRCSPTTPSR